MDSEDEIMIAREDNPRLDDYMCLFQEMRLYEDKEKVLRGKRQQHRRYGTHDWKSQVSNRRSALESIDAQIAYHRIRRFLDTIKGFYTGSLDLTGRHKSRYLSLMERWDDFWKDTKSVMNKRGESHEAMDVDDPLGQDSDVGHLCTDIPSFEKKWKVRNAFPFWDLVSEAVDVLECMVKHREPKFQKLSLQHLPPEIIHNIMLQCGRGLYPAESKHLGLTSRYFREISLPHIFHTIEMRIYPDLDIDSFILIPDDQKRKHIAEKLYACRQRLLDRLSFSCSRVDILRRIQHLHITSHLPQRYVEVAETDETVSQFFQPMLDLISEVFSGTMGLRSLSLWGINITQSMGKVLSSLKHLRALNLHNCSSDPWLDPDGHCPPSTSEFTFDVSISDKDQRYNWQLLKYFSNVTTLILDVEKENWMLALPPPELQAQVNPFDTVQKLLITKLNESEVEPLAVWVRAAGSSLQLTHFKLDIQGGIGREEVFDLLEALSGAPMRKLVLNGLYYAEPDILDRIARAFPYLHSLTLYLRQSNRQVRDRKPARWPRPSWEYALHLAHFGHLKKFLWNFEVAGYEATPSLLTSFETSFTDLSDEAYRTASRFDDLYLIPKGMAAYCPSLGYVAFLGSELGYSISTDENGCKNITQENFIRGLWSRRPFEDIDLSWCDLSE